jgi:hypothetical protein
VNVAGPQTDRFTDDVTVRHHHDGAAVAGQPRHQTAQPPAYIMTRFPLWQRLIVCQGAGGVMAVGDRFALEDAPAAFAQQGSGLYR